MGKYEIHFKIDTGTDVSMIPESLYRRMNAPKLQEPKKLLKSPGQSPLNVKGKFLTTLKLGENTMSQEVNVVDGLHTGLLDNPAIIALGLGMRIEPIIMEPEIKKRLLKLFQGLGNLEGEYHIKLIPNANPFALLTPR